MRLHRTENRKHYTGMLALEEITDEIVKENEAITGTTAFYIVDGQQRITSLIIILNSLIAYVSDELPNQDMTVYKDLLIVNDIIYRFGYSYKRQDGAAEFFEERIYKNNTSLPHADRCWAFLLFLAATQTGGLQSSKTKWVLSMPRMPKYLKEEWAIFLDERGKNTIWYAVWMFAC